MRRNIDKIKIQEPPIEQLTKKNSCAKRSCASGFGCIIIFLIASLLLLKFATGPKIKELKAVPDNFPKSVTLYDTDNITKITFVSGKEKSRVVEAAVFIPKLLLSPMVLMLDNNVTSRKTTDANGRLIVNKTPTWRDWFNYMKEPVTDKRDIVQIEWSALPAEPRFIQNYYKTELKKDNYKIEDSASTDNVRQFHFSSIKENVEGVIYIEDDPKNSGTDYVSLTVNFGDITAIDTTAIIPVKTTTNTATVIDKDTTTTTATTTTSTTIATTTDTTTTSTAQ